MNFSLDQIAAFVSTVEEGSFKSAAIKLNKHATTISQQVASLEIDLGFALFDRQVRKLHLTEQGRLCYANAKGVMVEARHLQSKVSGLISDVPSTFTVGLDTTVRDRQLVRCVKELSDAFPTIDITILHGDALSIIEMAEQGIVDVGVINSLFTTHRSLTMVQLFSYEIVSIASSKWLGEQRVKSESDVRIYPQIVMQYIQQSNSLQGHIFSNRVYTAQSLMDQLDMVSMGMGWAIVPKFQALDMLDSGDLVEFKIEGGKNINWSAELIYGADKTMNPVLAMFIENTSSLSNR